MKYYYGDKNILQVLSESAFWKHQEQEHTELIMSVMPDLEQEYIDELK